MIRRNELAKMTMVPLASAVEWFGFPEEAIIRIHQEHEIGRWVSGRLMFTKHEIEILNEWNLMVFRTAKRGTDECGYRCFCRSAVEAIRICNCNWWTEPPEPEESTEHQPGSPEKVELMIQRMRDGESLFHSDDTYAGQSTKDEAWGNNGGKIRIIPDLSRRRDNNLIE